MSKSRRRTIENNVHYIVEDEPILARHDKEVKPLKPRTKAQADYLHSIENNIITFGIGPAGTGKTYVSASYAAQQLKDGLVEKIIITRPVVESGESLGFLPGELAEKYQPFIEPLLDVFNERLGKSFTKYCLSHEKIHAKPMAYMRGCTFKNAIVILDEAQNTTPDQMKLFLTRIGDDCKVVIDGDLSQSDLSITSGLEDAIKRVTRIPSVGVITFGVEDIVRSGIAKQIVKAYSYA